MKILWLILIVIIYTQIPQPLMADTDGGGYAAATPIPQPLLETGGK